MISISAKRLKSHGALARSSNPWKEVSSWRSVTTTHSLPRCMKQGGRNAENKSLSTDPRHSMNYLVPSASRTMQIPPHRGTVQSNLLLQDAGSGKRRTFTLAMQIRSVIILSSSIGRQITW